MSASHDSRRHEKDIPESLGMVLCALRQGLGVDQPTMRTILEATPSQFPLPPPRKVTSNRGALISSWERGRENILFAMQHRYGTIAGAYSGVLHIVSLFYSKWRDAEKTNDPDERQRLLEENTRIAHGLIELAEFVLSQNPKMLSSSAGGTGSSKKQQLNRILELIDAYCTGAGTTRLQQVDLPPSQIAG